MKKKTKGLILGLIVVIIVGIIAFVFTFGSNKTKIGNREMPEANGISDELTKGLVIRQNFINQTEDIKEVAVVFHRLYDLSENDINTAVCIELLSEGKTLASTLVKANDIPDQHRVYLKINSPISGYVCKELTLKIYETDGSDTGVALLVSNDNNETYYVNDNPVTGSICFSITGK